MSNEINEFSDVDRPIVRHGMVLQRTDEFKWRPLRLQLTNESLTLQKEVPPPVVEKKPRPPTPSTTEIRNVTLYKEHPQDGLGLSIKGGSDFRLPVIISKILPDKIAEKSNKLFVGDAILKINGINVDQCTHDQVVKMLRSQGDLQLTLTVRHVAHVSNLLSGTENESSSDKSPQPSPRGKRREKQYTNLLSLPLTYAFISKYLADPPSHKYDSFEMISSEGETTGILRCDDDNLMNEWINCISNNIASANARCLQELNEQLTIDDRLIHACWVCEKITNTTTTKVTWPRKFFALRGAYVYLFDQPPKTLQNWLDFVRQYKVYECMLKIVKPPAEECAMKPHCIIVRSGHGDWHCFSVETSQQLSHLEKAWYQANCQAISQLKCLSYSCTFDGRMCVFVMDKEAGFTLYEGDTKKRVWQFRHSQLRRSSDDGRNKLSLSFDQHSQHIQHKDIYCGKLQLLLFCMHSFMAAKLSEVDPYFLRNT